MKEGDLIYNREIGDRRYEKGILFEFIPATHPKETQKIKVLVDGQVENWLYQYCSVVK